MGILVAPKVTRLSQDEIDSLSKAKRGGGKRAAVIAEYRSAFDGENALGIGDWAVIEAADRTESLKNKRHAAAAAKEFGYALEFYRYDATKQRVPFKVISLAEFEAMKAAKPPRKPRTPRAATVNAAPTSTGARVRNRA